MAQLPGDLRPEDRWLLTSRRVQSAGIGSRLPALGSRLPALGSRLPALGSRLPALGSRLPALGSRLPALPRILVARSWLDLVLNCTMVLMVSAFLTSLPANCRITHRLIG
jgi:hypothetical protein